MPKGSPSPTQSLPNAKSFRTRATIAAYSSYGTEPPTDALIARLASMGATVVLPIIRTPEDPLLWADASSPLKPDVRGIPTPAGNVVARNAADLLAINCRVIIVPALGVAKDGTRLGQGGGYYDRLLRHFPSHASISGGPLRLTIVNESEVFDELPSDPHDQRVDRWVIA